MKKTKNERKYEKIIEHDSFERQIKMSKVPERIFLFKLDTYDDTIMSPEWDTDAECEYPAEPVAYIQADLAQSVPDDVRQTIQAGLDYLDAAYDGGDGLVDEAINWLDSLKETA